MKNRKRRRKKNIAHQNGSRREVEANVRLLGNHHPVEPVEVTMRMITTILRHADRREEGLPQEEDGVVVTREAGDLVAVLSLSPTEDSRLRLLGA